MEEKKVFVLVNEWSYEYEQDLQVRVFDTFEKAQAAMREGYDAFVRRECDEYSVFDDCKVEPTYCSVSSYGDWSRNHCAWSIHKEIVR